MISDRSGGRALARLPVAGRAPRSLLAFLPLLTLLFLLAGCVTGGDQFLVKTLSDQQKAAALVKAGIAAYDSRLVRGGDYTAIDEVGGIFRAALDFDPENRDAAKYVALVADYRSARLRANVREANALLKKAKRSEAEDLSIAVMSRRAMELDDQDEEARALYKQTAELRSGLVETFLARAQEQMDKVKPESSASAKEKAYVEAYKNLNSALRVEPASAKVGRSLTELRKELSELVKLRLAGLEALLKKKAYPDARGQLVVLKDLDAKLDGSFRAEIAAWDHQVNYEWAVSLYAAKNYSEAETRIDAAIAAKKDAEALDLKKKISAARAAVELGATFEAGIQNLDKAIAARDFPKALRLVSGLAGQKLDAAQKRSLDERRERIAAAQAQALSDSYEAGVRAYKDEKFKEAIAALELVVSIDSGYLDAADYLEKARAKQKLLDQF